MSLILLPLLLVQAWPVAAVSAGVLGALAMLALTGKRRMRDRSRALTRAGGLLTFGASLATAAAYGYGLAATTFGAVTDADDRCGLARPDLYGYGYRGPADGSLRMWPLHDTTCGPDLVPGFVNPLVAGSAVLFVALAAVTAVMKIRSMERRSTS
ncbi:hypothetical protein OG992_31735 [Micromonospora sp. NBC_00362]|uniref:hypothetical protein n=1 Tax=Micromonospora sp. NBC_00362 TaxID=2975975 RepID=UPI00224E4FEC|nr:hypothetical protein [Micromonospora sp. NBC_00362]MCX5121751.1 hypothetical protein [Micromonospora sp. NBC_00362]